MIKKLLKIIFPNICLKCHKIINNGYFCSEHFNELEFITNACNKCATELPQINEGIDICTKCIVKKPKYQKLTASLRYNDLAKSLVTQYKYYDKTNLASFFSSLILRDIKPFISEIDFIIPVPLHQNRLISRKFNQASLICFQLAKKTSIKYLPNLLIRTIKTKPQNKLNKSMRLKNVNNAFIFNQKYANITKNKSILLIDDIVTTGATVESCCKYLLKGGVGKVYIATISKTTSEF